MANEMSKVEKFRISARDATKIHYSHPEDPATEITVEAAELVADMRAVRRKLWYRILLTAHEERRAEASAEAARARAATVDASKIVDASKK